MEWNGFKILKEPDVKLQQETIKRCLVLYMKRHGFEFRIEDYNSLKKTGNTLEFVYDYKLKGWFMNDILFT